MDQVINSGRPATADIRRQLINVEHELGELLALGGGVTRDTRKYSALLAAQQRTQEALAHLTAAEQEV